MWGGSSPRQFERDETWRRMDGRASRSEILERFGGCMGPGAEGKRHSCTGGRQAGDLRKADSFQAGKEHEKRLCDPVASLQEELSVCLLSASCFLLLARQHQTWVGLGCT
ncbi:hypothetical protein MPTK1_8g10010 [Marchantia polymorpha subsp. ruderalis]|uniref:Uncharacterized protein n=1 Tax=Marchantia polymorpha TaxID=3197 RepID=A0A2R6XMX1_MARPO|nr:hypothetical protein MARPO_0008s0221 [Marchantia polymorpha]BBN19358.1 hypothetical protein Mp_8g10010 [Marchantia polymorpha subsp. ruderalis]|eukprot:PTQ47475.1 hypothetical protein MARPO_0008s0221 [Marchantia polymorpha]